MKFRKFMLDDYLNGEEGQKCWEFFFNFRKHFEDRENDPAFYNFVTSNVNGEGYAKPAFNLEMLKDFNIVDDIVVDDVKYSCIDDFVQDMAIDFVSDAMARSMQPCMAYLSVDWFLRFPEFAIPYLVPRHFYKIQIICREFDIPIPKIPPKNDHAARCNYYFALCKAFHDFRDKSELSPTELCGFLYGYAMRFVDAIVQASIRRSRQIFLLYASPEDREIFLSKDITPDEVTIWQGKPEMEPGDIVLMYERAPKSCISSVWRVETPGFDDPFDSWSGKVFIGEYVSIPEITFDDLCANPVWSKKPLLAAHMQGGSGKVCSVEEYESFLGMVKAKDSSFDMTILPSPPEKVNFDELGLSVEHDVEIKLLEPLLKKLGFAEHEWVTQFIIRIGRDNTSRPDYVVHLNDNGVSPTADFVFEAKLSIPTKRQLCKDYGQCLAYGKLLYAKVIALVAREGVWLWTRGGGDVPFQFENVHFENWSDLNNPETILVVKSLFK